MTEAVEPRFFTSAAEWRKWLEKNHSRQSELTLGFWKASLKKGLLSVPQAVEEALCFGWIDGRGHNLDAERYAVRFTPRKKGSIWSAVNIARMQKLEADGRMTEHGRAVYANRNPKRAGLYSFEQPEESKLTPELAGLMAADAKATRFFEAQTPSYRRTAVFWVMSAKKEETREKRMQVLVASSHEHALAPPFAFGTAKPKDPDAAAAKPAPAAKKATSKRKQ